MLAILRSAIIIICEALVLHTRLLEARWYSELLIVLGTFVKEHPPHRSKQDRWSSRNSTLPMQSSVGHRVESVRRSITVKESIGNEPM